MEFLVIMVVQAEFSVPNPKAVPIAHRITVNVDGTIAMSRSPMLCATMPTTQTIRSPPLSWILPAIGLDKTRQIEYIIKNHEKMLTKSTSTAYNL